jgi:hypothetical protein
MAATVWTSASGIILSLSIGDNLLAGQVICHLRQGHSSDDKFSCQAEGMPLKIMFFMSLSEMTVNAGGLGNSGK